MFFNPLAYAGAVLAAAELRRFEKLPREEQEFRLKKRETEAPERIANAMEHQRPNINNHHHYY